MTPERGRGNGGKKPEAGTSARRPKVQKGWVINMAGLYRDESLGAGRPAPGLENSG